MPVVVPSTLQPKEKVGSPTVVAKPDDEDEKHLEEDQTLAIQTMAFTPEDRQLASDTEPRAADQNIGNEVSL